MAQPWNVSSSDHYDPYAEDSDNSDVEIVQPARIYKSSTRIQTEASTSKIPDSPPEGPSAIESASLKRRRTSRSPSSWLREILGAQPDKIARKLSDVSSGRAEDSRSVSRASSGAAFESLRPSNSGSVRASAVKEVSPANPFSTWFSQNASLRGHVPADTIPSTSFRPNLDDQTSLKSKPIGRSGSNDSASTTASSSVRRTNIPLDQSSAPSAKRQKQFSSLSNQDSAMHKSTNSSPNSYDWLHYPSQPVASRATAQPANQSTKPTHLSSQRIQNILKKSPSFSTQTPLPSTSQGQASTQTSSKTVTTLTKAPTSIAKSASIPTQAPKSTPPLDSKAASIPTQAANSTPTQRSASILTQAPTSSTTLRPASILTQAPNEKSNQRPASTATQAPNSILTPRPASISTQARNTTLRPASTPTQASDPSSHSTARPASNSTTDLVPTPNPALNRTLTSNITPQLYTVTPKTANTSLSSSQTLPRNVAHGETLSQARRSPSSESTRNDSSSLVHLNESDIRPLKNLLDSNSNLQKNTATFTDKSKSAGDDGQCTSASQASIAQSFRTVQRPFAEEFKTSTPVIDSIAGSPKSGGGSDDTLNPSRTDAANWTASKGSTRSILNEMLPANFGNGQSRDASTGSNESLPKLSKSAHVASQSPDPSSAAVSSKLDSTQNLRQEIEGSRPLEETSYRIATEVQPKCAPNIDTPSESSSNNAESSVQPNASLRSPLVNTLSVSEDPSNCTTVKDHHLSIVASNLDGMSNLTAQDHSQVSTAETFEVATLSQDQILHPNSAADSNSAEETAHETAQINEVEELDELESDGEVPTPSFARIPSNPVICKVPECGRGFSTLITMRNHLRSYHRLDYLGRKVLQCRSESCSRNFVQENKRERHEIIFHNLFFDKDSDLSLSPSVNEELASRSNQNKMETPDRKKALETVAGSSSPSSETETAVEIKTQFISSDEQEVAVEEIRQSTEDIEPHAQRRGDVAAKEPLQSSVAQTVDNNKVSSSLEHPSNTSLPSVCHAQNQVEPSLLLANESQALFAKEMKDLHYKLDQMNNLNQQSANQLSSLNAKIGIMSRELDTERLKFHLKMDEMESKLEQVSLSMVQRITNLSADIKSTQSSTIRSENDMFKAIFNAVIQSAVSKKRKRDGDDEGGDREFFPPPPVSL